MQLGAACGLQTANTFLQSACVTCMRQNGKDLMDKQVQEVGPTLTLTGMRPVPFRHASNAASAVIRPPLSSCKCQAL